MKVEHCVFLHLKAYLFLNKTILFWFFISKNLCFVRRLFENQNQNFRNFWLFKFFSKNNLDDHFKKKTRNYGGTHWLPNKSNRNVLASKLRSVKTFQKKVKFAQKNKNSKTMHRRKFFPRIKSVFFTFYYSVPNFRALGLIMNDFCFLLVGPLKEMFIKSLYSYFFSMNLFVNILCNCYRVAGTKIKTICKNKHTFSFSI